MLGVLIGWFGLDLLPHSLISRPLDHLINKAVSTSPLLRLYLHSFLPNKRVKYCALLSGKLPGNLFHSLSIVTTVGTSICVFLPLSTNPSLRGHVVNVGEPIDSVYYWTFATLSKLIHWEMCSAWSTTAKVFNPLCAWVNKMPWKSDERQTFGCICIGFTLLLLLFWKKNNVE